MRKLFKALSLGVAAVMVCTALSACSSQQEISLGSEVVTTEAIEETKKPDSPSHEKDETNDTTPATEEVTEPEKTEVVNPVGTSDIDISHAIEDTTVEAPAKLGEWIKSARFNSASLKWETIYWRVVSVTSDCQSAIDRYNSESPLVPISPLTDENMSYYKVSYQVYYPEDYSQEDWDWGITVCPITLSIRNPYGGDFVTNDGISYEGFTFSFDVSPEQEVHPGDVFNGETVFAMLKDQSVEYVFEYARQISDTEGTRLRDYAASR